MAWWIPVSVSISKEAVFMSKNQEKNTAKKNVFVRIGATLWRWTKRMFMGASKELTQDEKLFVERIESPSMMAVKGML